MLYGETLAVGENQLKRLLVVLCALAVALTVVGAINAFEPLKAGFVWTVEWAYALIAGVIDDLAGDVTGESASRTLRISTPLLPT